MRLMGFGEFLKKNKIAVVIFFLAVIIRLALFFVYLDFNKGDFVTTVWGADGYSDISQNLIHGNGYSDASAPPFLPNSIRPPAWIFVIALFTKVFASFVPIFIFQLVLSGLIPIMGMYLAGRIIPAGYAPIVGVLLALEPAAVFSATMMASETSFTFFFLAFIIFLSRYFDNHTIRNIVWSAVFLGISILMKPTVQFLPILVPIGLFFIYRKSFSVNLFKHSFYFILVSVLVLAPWLYRNYREFGTVGLTSQPAYNLYTVLVPTVLSIDTGTNYDVLQRAIAKTVPSESGGITLSNSKEYIDKSLAIFGQHKLAFIKSMGISLVTFFTHDHMLTVLGYAGVTIPNLLEKPALVLLLTKPLKLARDIVFYAASPGILVLLVRLFWIFITVMFFSGAWFFFRREKFSPVACLAFLTVLYFAAMTAANGFGMNGRFRIPVNTFIFTFAVYGFAVVRQYIVGKFFSYHA